MKRILGLDLGTTSIGWAVVDEAENEKEQSSIIKLGVRVVPLSTDEQSDFERGKAVQTNVVRRQKRSIRRNAQRFKLRRERLMALLRNNGILSPESPCSERGTNSTYQTYRDRAAAASQQISLDAFARVLLMINGKRGYRSNRKVKDDSEGVAIDGIKVARILHDEGLTPGQYMLRRLNEEKNARLPFYPSDLQDEFDRIWSCQSKFYPEILTDALKNELAGLSRTQASKVFASHNVLTVKAPPKEVFRQSLIWRMEALSQKQPIDVVAYVLCDICGAISNNSGLLGQIGDRSKELIMNRETIGEHLLNRIERNPHEPLRNTSTYYRQDYMDEFDRIWDTQAKYYPQQLTPELRDKIRNEVIFYQRPLKSCKNLINFCEFEQEQRTVVIDGKQKVITTGARSIPKSSPLFQEFKIWQNLNDIIVTPIDAKRSKKKPTEGGSADDKRWLSLEEMNILHQTLWYKKTMSKAEALKLLYGKDAKNYTLNFDKIEGNHTMATILDAIQEIISMSGNGDHDFSKMDYEDIEYRINSIFNGLEWNKEIFTFDPLQEGHALESQPFYHLWHLLYSYAGDNSVTGLDALVEKLMALTNMSEEYAKVLAKVSFNLDYGNLSAKAIRKILPKMMEGKRYSDACNEVGYRHSKSSLTREEIDNKELAGHLEVLPLGSLRSPVVEKILNQMVHVINGLLTTYGRTDSTDPSKHYFDEVRIELARDLKKNSEQRERMAKAVKANNERDEKIREVLRKEFNLPRITRDSVIRYRLYQELKNNGYKTLYTNTFISRNQIFSKEFDIEHIIPQSRLFDDSFSNLTLEKRDANIEKGDKTAMDYICSKYDERGVEDYKTRVRSLQKAKEDNDDSEGISAAKVKKLLMTGDEIPQNFLNRDLSLSQYISRKASEMLYEITRNVVPTTGSITARLRDDWQLVNVMQELNWDKYDKQGLTEVQTTSDGRKVRVIKDWTKRNDHRHHAMDALTIAFTRPNIIKYLNNVNHHHDPTSDVYHIRKTDMYSPKDGRLRFTPPIPLDQFRADAKCHLESILVSIKAKNKVVTRNVNKAKQGSGHQSKVQLTPRGYLHKETVFGKITQYDVEEKRVDGKMTKEVAQTVCSKLYREALLKRLEEFNGDAKKAFTDKNSIDKKPIFVNEAHSDSVPAVVKVKTPKIVMTKNVEVSDLKTKDIVDVIDPHIRQILQDRVNSEGNKAFANLDKNPIWQNKEKGIAIKRVKVNAHASIDGTCAVHVKRDIDGKVMRNVEGNVIPTDYVQLQNNHHVAIFRDAEGNLQEHVVTFMEAVNSVNLGLPVVDKSYNKDKGWTFLYTMKRNEYFVFPDEEGFDPNEIDLMDAKNAAIISPHLYRIQKIGSKDYWFRHHLETVLNNDKRLQGVVWKRVTSINNLEGIVKVRVNHIGQIVAVGEY